MSSFPFISQPNSMDCGPACLFMVAKHYGKTITLNSIRENTGFGKEGVSLLGISEAAELIGFRTRGVLLTFDQLICEATLPAVLHWRMNHFIVLPPQKFKKKYIVIADPSNKTLMKVSMEDFRKNWQQEDKSGIALLMEPTPSFYEQESMKINRVGWQMLWQYAKEYKKYFV